jgi:multidrug efflux pump subunit AcrB
VEVARRVKARVAELQKTLPHGVTLAVNYDGSVFVEQPAHALNFNLILAAVLTSASTVAAAIPPALALGPGAETRAPMALVIIGGVTVSTFLTLFVVPCAYSLMNRLKNHRHDADVKEALRELGELPH